MSTSWSSLLHVEKLILCNAHLCSGCPGLRWHSSQGLLARPLQITGASYQRYGLPLSKPLTTGSATQLREGFLLHISTSSGDGRDFKGVGEIAPLPGNISYSKIVLVSSSISYGFICACGLCMSVLSKDSGR